MPVACFLGRGKVHGALNAGSMPVGRDPLFVAEVYRRSASIISKLVATYIFAFQKSKNANKSLCPFQIIPTVKTYRSLKGMQIPIGLPKNLAVAFYIYCTIINIKGDSVEKRRY